MSRCRLAVRFALLLAGASAGVAAGADDGPTRVEFHRRQIQQIKHGGGFWSLAISRDGKLLVTASEDQTACLFETETGKPVGQPMRHDATVKEAVISADGKVVATAGGDGVARLWEARTGKQIGSDMRHAASVNSVVLSPDGKYALTGGQDGTARLWDATTGAPTGRVMKQQNSITRVAFMPDGRTVLSAGWDRAVRKWEVATGKALGLACSEPAGVTSLDVSRDGRFLITCSRDVGVRLWDSLTGKPLSAPVETQIYFGDVALGPDGSVFLTSGTPKLADGNRGPAEVRLWDTETLKPIGKPFANKNAIAFDPTGKVIAVGGDDGVVEIWEVQFHRAKAETVRPEAVEGLWSSMADDDAARAYRATSALIRSPEAAVSLLAKNLKPAATPDDKGAGKLIEELDDESFDVREKAERQLAANRRKWELQLKAALAKNPPEEVRTRLQRVLDSADEPVASADRLRELRAVQVLQAIGSDEAQRLLRTLAGGAEGADLTRDARAALARLAARQ